VRGDVVRRQFLRHHGRRGYYADGLWDLSWRSVARAPRVVLALLVLCCGAIKRGFCRTPVTYGGVGSDDLDFEMSGSP
jgi:hypothetical protein